MAQAYAEDLNLAPQQFPELNQRFFAEDRGPHVFIRHRIRGLLLAVSVDDAVTDRAAAGLELGLLKMTFPSCESPAGVNGTAELAALDAVVLFHHAAETLLQLLLVLEQRPACPWLEIAKLKRRGNGLARKIRDLQNRFKSRSTRDALIRVFYAQGPRGPEGIDKDLWADQVRGLQLIVAEAGRRFQQEVDLYNSAKHGLSAVQGQAALRFGGGESALIEATGPSLTILQTVPSKLTGGDVWAETTHWIDAARTVALTALVAQLIENAWLIARATYADGPQNGMLSYPSGKAVAALLNDDVSEKGYAFRVPEFTMPLIYTSAPTAFKRSTGNGGGP